jgi:hypothetical protein
MLVVKVARDGVHQDWEGGYAPQVAGLSHRQDPLHPAVPLLVVGALHHLAPEHGKPQRPLGSVIGRFHPCLYHKRPQGTQLALECAGQCPRLIFPEPILLQQMHQPRLPGLHGPRRGGRWRPVHQPRQFRHHPAPKSGQFGLLSLRQAPGPSDQLR